MLQREREKGVCNTLKEKGMLRCLTQLHFYCVVWMIVNMHKFENLYFKEYLAIHIPRVSQPFSFITADTLETSYLLPTTLTLWKHTFKKFNSISLAFSDYKLLERMTKQ